jgi:hypothetical protein
MLNRCVRRASVRRAVYLLLTLACGPAGAIDGTWGDFAYAIQNRVSVGAAWRLKDRDTDLIGKLNVPGQQQLCVPDDCLSFSGDPAPNQRLLEARGSFMGQHADDGNLNYDQGDIVAATAKLRSDLTLDWGDFQFRARGIAFFDTINHDREDRHTNTLHQPARTEQPGSVQRQIGADIALYELSLSREFDLDGRLLKLSVGRQTLHWGESTFIALNTLAELNPPNANRLYTPGGEINEVFEPVAIALISVDLFQNATAEAFYPLEWRPAQPAAAGSFFSDLEVIGGRDYVMISIGQFPEDPEAGNPIAGAPGLISSTTLRARVLEQDFGEPDSGGEFGLRFNYFAEELNGGTEFSLYAMNYHSRLQNVSAIAAEASCARDSANFAEAALACRGFNGTLNPSGLGLDPAPVGTMLLYEEYVRNIELYGASFNTYVAGWSLAGEYAYRPNLPVQISATDLVFAAGQPALPRQDIDLGVATLPSARRFIPDFISTYRGQDIQPRQRIPGYERLQVGQVDLTAIRILSASNNPVRADSILLVAEVGATHVIDMPDRKDLQFEGNVWHRSSHASPGADEGDAIRLNPTRQTKYFADSFAWGYRLFAELEYNDVLPGVKLTPKLAFFHDVGGIAVYPMQNFVEGRRQYMVGSDVTWRAWTAHLGYHAFAGRYNTLRDRDYASFALAYAF